jgi:DNA-directed RNA polymerase sigma subunit (sigma70/sigma32)
MCDYDELDPVVIREGRRGHMGKLREAGWSFGAIAKLYGISSERVREILNPVAHRQKARLANRRRYARRSASRLP